MIDLSIFFNEPPSPTNNWMIQNQKVVIVSSQPIDGREKRSQTLNQIESAVNQQGVDIILNKSPEQINYFCLNLKELADRINDMNKTDKEEVESQDYALSSTGIKKILWDIRRHQKLENEQEEPIEKDDKKTKKILRSKSLIDLSENQKKMGLFDRAKLFLGLKNSKENQQQAPPTLLRRSSTKSYLNRIKKRSSELERFEKKRETAYAQAIACLDWLNNHSIVLESEGILRLSGAQTKIDEEIKRKNFEFYILNFKITKDEDVHIITGILKKHLRENPLIPEGLVDEYLAIAKSENIPDGLKKFITNLPKVEQLLMKKLCAILKQIADKQAKNKMTLENICTSLGCGCNLFDSSKIDTSLLLSLSTSASAAFVLMKNLIEHQEIFADDIKG
jgi:hypothetical protein